MAVSNSGLLSALAGGARRARHLPALARRLPLFADPLRFARCEISSLEVAMPHRLRRSGLTAYIRHHTLDIGALNTVFIERLYEPPAPALATLNGLGHAPRVLDVGGHIGMFGLFVLERWPQARILALEPDPLNAVILRRTVRANDRLDTWKVLDAGGSNRNTTATFRFGEGAESALADRGVAAGEEADGRLIDIELVDLFDHFDEYDLVKMNIEGGEWDVLLDERFPQAAFPALVLAYHPFGCPEPDSWLCAKRALEDAGYRVERTADYGGGMGMLWAWRPPAASEPPQVGSASSASGPNRGSGSSKL